MFDLLDRPLIWIAVKWPGLIQKDEAAVAEPVEHRVELQVEILDRPAYAKWLERGALDAGKDAIDEAEELALLKALARGWRGVRSGGSVVEFNDANLARLIAAPGFVTAFSNAYGEAWAGRAETRKGNSESSPVAGRAGEPSAVTETAGT